MLSGFLMLRHEKVDLAIPVYTLQKREAKACLEAAGHMLKMHAGGRIPLNRKEDEIYKVVPWGSDAP